MAVEAVAPVVVAPPPADEVKLLAGFDEGFGLQRKDGSFKATAGFIGQFDGAATSTDSGGKAAFLLRMARPNLRVSAFSQRLELFVQPELAGSRVGILDLQLTFAPAKFVGVTVGQFIVPQGRAFATPVPKLQFLDFGIVNDEFRAGRDVGVAVNGSLFDGIVDVAGGVFNGNGLNARVDHGWMWTARAAVSPLGAVAWDQTQALSHPDAPFRFSLGVNAWQRDGERNTTIVDTDTKSIVSQALPDQVDLVIGPDLYAVWGPASLLAEGYWRTRNTPGLDDAVSAAGAFVQAGVFVVPSLVEVVGRVGALDRNLADDKAGSVAAYEAGANIYPIGNHLKLQAKYQLTDQQTSAATPSALPMSHAVTLQAQFQL